VKNARRAGQPSLPTRAVQKWSTHLLAAALGMAAGAMLWQWAANSSTKSPSCTGTCYFVSPNGNDANAGTSSSAPWRSIAKVNTLQSSLKPGDSVLFQRGGVWYEQLDINNMNGSRGFPVTIGNYGTGSLPVIDGGQTSSVRGRDYCINAINTSFKWITIDGIECRNAYTQGITFRAYSGTGTNGVGIVVQNSYIHHDGPGACTSCGPTPAPDGAGYSNQLDAQLTTGVQFLNNTLDHLGGHNALNVHFDTGGPVVKGNIVGTAAPYCNHNCIDLKGAVGAQVLNNVVTCPSCRGATAAFYTENTGYRGASAETITYIGNIVNKVPIGFQVETGGTCLSSPCSIQAKYYNNTIYIPRASAYNFIDSSCSNHTLDIQKNIIDGGETDIHSNCMTTWDYNDDGGVYPIRGNPVGPHDLKQVNPQYVNASARDLTPQNTTILSWGANDSVTSFTYLGARQ
jgi:hypothetical protein